ncbi:MAG TPA: hypothetical protein VGM73_12730 [Candidatus Didemnitutus sp.]|jgi:hypothetical protein
MRVILAGVLLAAAGLSAAAASAPPDHPQPVQIEHAYAGWREAVSFKRISEYFTGRENTGGEIILRTHPTERGGYYFLVRVDNTGAPVPVKMNVRIISPDSGVARSFTFSPTLPVGRSLFDLGLTGPDWPGKNTHAVAWRLDIVDNAGNVLASEKSYLWEKPAGL